MWSFKKFEGSHLSPSHPRLVLFSFASHTLLPFYSPEPRSIFCPSSPSILPPPSPSGRQYWRCVLCTCFLGPIGSTLAGQCQGCIGRTHRYVCVRIASLCVCVCAYVRVNIDRGVMVEPLGLNKMKVCPGRRFNSISFHQNKISYIVLCNSWLSRKKNICV